jgi:hypothetical protein
MPVVTMMASTLPVVSRGLRIFPAEIREMVYGLACVFDGKMPSLIKALRPDKVLYQEAIYWFYKNSTYKLGCASGWGFADMSGEMIGTIQKLQINLE